MLSKELRIMAGTINSGKIYFSASNCNGLFSYDIGSNYIELLGIFEREGGEDFVLHRECYVCGNWLVFIPQRGGHLDLYNIDSGEFRRIDVAEKDAVKAFSSGEYFDNKLYILPLAREKHPLILDFETFQISENNLLMECMKEFSEFNELPYEMIFARSFIKNGRIYAGLYGTGKYISYDVLDNKLNMHNSDIRDILCVQQGNEGMWVVGLSGEIEFIGDNGKKIKYNTKVDNLAEGRWAYNRVLDLSGTGIVLPAFGEHILKLVDGRIEVIQYPAAFKELMNSEWLHFFCGAVSGDEAYIYPFTYKYMLKITDNSVENVPLEYIKSNDSLDEKAKKFFYEDMKHILGCSGEILMESKVQYDVKDFISII